MFEIKINDESLSVGIKAENFDASLVDSFRESLQSVDFTNLSNASIDMEGVEFIDSSGVGALLGVIKKIGSKEQVVSLRNVSPSVLSVLELLKLDNIFNIETKG